MQEAWRDLQARDFYGNGNGDDGDDDNDDDEAGSLEGPAGTRRVPDEGGLKELSFAAEQKWGLDERRENQRNGKVSEEKIYATSIGKETVGSEAEAAKTKEPEPSDISTRALPTPPVAKKCNWGILGFGSKKSASATKSNSNWAAPKSPGCTNKEITSEAKIASDKQPLTTRPPTPTTTTTPTTTEPPKLPEKVKKQTANLSGGGAADALNQASWQIATKPPIKTGQTAKQESQAREETAKQTTSEQSSSSVAPQPTPPPRKRRSSGQRY